MQKPEKQTHLEESKICMGGSENELYIVRLLSIRALECFSLEDEMFSGADPELG